MRSLIFLKTAINPLLTSMSFELTDICVQNQAYNAFAFSILTKYSFNEFIALRNKGTSYLYNILIFWIGPG